VGRENISSLVIQLRRYHQLTEAFERAAAKGIGRRSPVFADWVKMLHLN
jgi:hypothetical protein